LAIKRYARDKQPFDAKYHIQNQVLQPTDVYAIDFADEIDPLRAEAAGEMTEGLDEEKLDLGNEEAEEPQPPVVSKTMPAQTSQRQPMPPSLVLLQQKPPPRSPRKREAGRHDRRDHSLSHLTLFLLGVRVGMEVAIKIYGVRKERGKGEILVEQVDRKWLGSRRTRP
jgi:hypothetical protein